ncbi:hypothetical protein KY284_025608 [Solanum tuberosum]|nr:hypothetical protein KY284_025608 [Solanum tuberosum]
MTSFSPLADKMVLVSAKEFAKFSQYQKSLKESTSVNAFTESDKTCLITSSNKWVIDSGAANHMTGHVSDDLYILDEWESRSIACSSVMSPFEVHCRLGHPSVPLLKNLCPQFQNISSLECESCQFAKHHRHSIGLRVNK